MLLLTVHYDEYSSALRSNASDNSSQGTPFTWHSTANIMAGSGGFSTAAELVFIAVVESPNVACRSQSRTCLQVANASTHGLSEPVPGTCHCAQLLCRKAATQTWGFNCQLLSAVRHNTRHVWQCLQGLADPDFNNAPHDRPSLHACIRIASTPKSHLPGDLREPSIAFSVIAFRTCHHLKPSRRNLSVTCNGWLR